MLARSITVADVEDLRIRSDAVKPGEVTLHAPLPRPGKIICVGLNYHDHCREQSIEPPAYPILFSKFANAVADPGERITRPIATEKLDLECELAVVIGRRASRIRRDEAASVVFGYTVLNDVTMRDLQHDDRQWLRAKGSDGFAPMGPAVVTADELTRTGDVRLRSSVNGETWQDSTTAEMIFDVATIVAFASRTITLEPGDVIAGGTLDGTGDAAGVYLKAGDVMDGSIGELGNLVTPVVAASA
jgi:2-keto-4-pentenoate hydratase/2-oxohepta-3-ene-1,7-dioic acid hydratase in catechol pathway